MPPVQRHFACLALLFLMTGSVCSVSGQQTEADSLRAVVSEITTEDTNRVNSLLALAWILRMESPSEAMDYSNEALELSSRLNFLRGKATSQSTIGVIHYRSGNLPEALSAHLQALKLRDQIGDQNGVAKSCINIGNIYTDMGNMAEAMANYQRAMGILESTGDEERLAMVCLNIGGLYLAQGQNEPARTFCIRTAEIAESLGDPLLEAQALNNSGVCYQNLGKSDSAMWAYNQSYKLAESESEKVMMVDAGINIGNMYRQMGDITNAIKWHNDMVSIAQDDGYTDALADLFHQLSDDYAARGDYRSAYESYVRFKTYSDSIYNENNSEIIAEMQAKYESEQKDMELARLENKLEKEESQRQRGSVWIIVGVVGFLLVTGLIIAIVIVSGNRKRDRMIIEAQQNQISRMYSNPGMKHSDQYNKQ